TIKLNGEVVDFKQTTVLSDVDHTAALTEAVFTLPSPLKPNESLQLEVGYSGTIAREATRLTHIGAPRDKANLAEWDAISEDFIGIRGIGYANWYPVAIAPVSMLEGNRVFESLGKWKLRHSE